MTYISHSQGRRRSQSTHKSLKSLQLKSIALPELSSKVKNSPKVLGRSDNERREYLGKINLPDYVSQVSIFAELKPSISFIMDSKSCKPYLEELPNSLRYRQHDNIRAFDDNLQFKKLASEQFDKDVVRKLIFFKSLTSLDLKKSTQVIDSKHLFKLLSARQSVENIGLLTGIAHQGLLANLSELLVDVLEPGAPYSPTSPASVTIIDNEGKLSLQADFHVKVELPDGDMLVSLKQQTNISFESVKYPGRDSDEDHFTTLVATSEGIKNGTRVDMDFIMRDSAEKNNIPIWERLNGIFNLFPSHEESVAETVHEKKKQPSKSWKGMDFLISFFERRWKEVVEIYYKITSFFKKN